MDDFKKTCIRELESLPHTQCSDGKPIINGSTKPPKCYWWINSKKHNYCFWKYVYQNSDVEGIMPALKIEEVAKKLGLSLGSAHAVLKDAERQLLKIIKEELEIDSMAEIQSIIPIDTKLVD